MEETGPCFCKVDEHGDIIDECTYHTSTGDEWRKPPVTVKLTGAKLVEPPGCDVWLVVRQVDGPEMRVHAVVAKSARGAIDTLETKPELLDDFHHAQTVLVFGPVGNAMLPEFSVVGLDDFAVWKAQTTSWRMTDE